MSFTIRVLTTAALLWAAICTIEAIERPAAEEFSVPFHTIERALQ